MKKIIAALISLTLFYSSTVCIFAIENQECPYYEEITDVIELKKGPVLYLNEKKNDTYWEFSDNEEAFKTINSLEHDLISILSTNYNLDNLEKSNWLDYKNALENEISLNHISESFHTQRLLTFFNVCDNCDLNNEIRQIVKTDDYSMDELAVLMPYTSPYYKEYERKATINTYTTMNVTNAINGQVAITILMHALLMGTVQILLLKLLEREELVTEVIGIIILLKVIQRLG